MKSNSRHPRTRERALIIYQWVKDYQNLHGYSPSFSEISQALSMSTSHVSHVRDAMVDFKLMRPVPPWVERAWPLLRIPKEFMPNVTETLAPR